MCDTLFALVLKLSHFQVKTSYIQNLISYIWVCFVRGLVHGGLEDLN